MRMEGGNLYFWLGASASADTGHSAKPEPVVSALSGECPARWFFRQYGYEKFSVYDERGTEIGFVHRRRDAERIATEVRA